MEESDSAHDAEVTSTEEIAPLLAAPRTPLPQLITTAAALDDAIAQLSQGSGDIALDAERASGYKYSQRAYLIQIFRRGGGLHLIDPIALFAQTQEAPFARLNAVIQSAPVVIHASSQDLPCLREIGLHPRELFDTEVAGRIAGFPRVGLGALTQSLLNLRLAKEHSAVDWSQRPLHHDWLIYAALDVDVLLDVKDEIVRVLTEKNKLGWAQQESAAALLAKGPTPRKEPWRRTSGIHQIKRPEQLAFIRELWMTRDQIARERDIASGRILNDRAMVNLALKPPATLIHLRSIPAVKKDAHLWWEAIERARANPAVPKAPPAEGPPTQMRIWREKAPLSYARLTHAKAQLAQVALQNELPTENLLSPDHVRRFCWPDPPEGGWSAEEVAEKLAQFGARPWQIALSASILHGIQWKEEPLPPPAAASEVASEDASTDTSEEVSELS